MRRDEIRIFPGNVEAHINRLQQLDNTDAPLAAEAPPPTKPPESPDSLDYVSPSAINPNRQRIARMIANVFASGVLGVAICMVVLAWWNDAEGFSVVFFRAAVVFSVPILWLSYKGVVRLCRSLRR